MKGILRRIKHSLWLIESNLFSPHHLEHFKQSLTVMAESHSSMVRVIFLNQHMAVEPAHLGDGKDTDGTKGAGRNRKHLTLCHVSAQVVIRRALKTVEGDVARDNIAL